MRIVVIFLAFLSLGTALTACEPSSGPRPEPERTGYS